MDSWTKSGSSTTSDKSKKINDSIDEFLLGLRRGRVTGSYEVSKKTASIMLQVVDSSEWQNAKGLIDLVKQYGKRLTQAKPLELAIVNTVRRVLYIIREEYKTSQIADTEERSKDFMDQAMLHSSGGFRRTLETGVPRGSGFLNRSGLLKNLVPAVDLSQSYSNLRTSIKASIQEFLDELGAAYSSIGDQALYHIHANEIIMTFGKSRTVEEFLKAAARKRKFEVVVVETSPTYGGQEMAMSLADAGIETTLITDTAVFAIMARVNKVIVGTHAVMANGGLVAVSGTHVVAQAAKYYSVPFVVCTGLYKLCPLYAHDQDTFNELRTPSEILPFSESQNLGVTVKNPVWDYIPPELVSLYITNTGGHSPTYIYRLLAEYYHPEDMEL